METIGNRMASILDTGCHWLTYHMNHLKARSPTRVWEDDSHTHRASQVYVAILLNRDELQVALTTLAGSVCEKLTTGIESHSWDMPVPSGKSQTPDAAGLHCDVP